MDASSARREAGRKTADTGKVHEVRTQRGLFRTRTTVVNTGRIASPAQRRRARNGW